MWTKEEVLLFLKKFYVTFMLTKYIILSKNYFRSQVPIKIHCKRHEEHLHSDMRLSQGIQCSLLISQNSAKMDHYLIMYFSTCVFSMKISQRSFEFYYHAQPEILSELCSTSENHEYLRTQISRTLSIPKHCSLFLEKNQYFHMLGCRKGTLEH